MEFLKYLLSQTPKGLLGIFLFCICAILIPNNILNRIGLLEIRNEYLVLLWVALFLSFSLLLSHALFSHFLILKSYVTKFLNDRKRKKRLHNLSIEERKILRGYIKKNTRTRSFSMFRGNHIDLVAFSVLYRSSNINMPGTDTLDYNIASWAWDYLRKHPELIE